MTAPIPVPGLILGDRYRLVRQLAVGGMGQVWVAQDESLSREVAIKVLKPEFAGNVDFLRRLRTEARNAASLSHTGIAQLFDYGERDGVGYLVLELVLGEPMSDLLERSPVLPLDRTLDILAQTARALHSAHVSGVVHRDVKPGNILLERSGIVKITDFGVSLAADQAPMTATGMVMGTAQYLSPEQAVGRPATPSSDIYALGVIAYEALVGHRPYTGKTAVDIAVAHVNEPVPALPASVPPDVASLVTRMLAKDPSDRPRSGARLAIAADELATKYRSQPWLGSVGAPSEPTLHAGFVSPPATDPQPAPTTDPRRAARARRDPGGQASWRDASPQRAAGPGQPPAANASAAGARQESRNQRSAPSRPPMRGSQHAAPSAGRDWQLGDSAPRGQSARPHAPHDGKPTARVSTSTGRRLGGLSWQALVLIVLVLAVLIGSLIGFLSGGNSNALSNRSKADVTRSTDGTGTHREQYSWALPQGPPSSMVNLELRVANPTKLKDV